MHRHFFAFQKRHLNRKEGVLFHQKSQKDLEPTRFHQSESKIHNFSFPVGHGTFSPGNDLQKESWFLFFICYFLEPFMTLQAKPAIVRADEVYCLSPFLLPVFDPTGLHKREGMLPAY